MPFPGRKEFDDALGGIDTKQYKYASFIYPQNLAIEGSGYPHYVIFFVNQSSNSQFETRTAGLDGSADAPTDNPTILSNLRNGATSAPSNKSILSSLQQPISRVASAIVLYYPHEIQMQQSVSWSSAELGSATALIDTITNRKEQSFKDNVSDLGWQWLGKAGQRGAEYLSRISNMSIKDAFSRAGRIAINPHLEVLFQGIEFRRFSFNYQFMPQSQDESDLVDNIIRAFKLYSAPEVDTSTASRFFRYPAEFDIKFYSHGKENDYINKISTCVMTDINVNYTGSGAGWSGFRPPDRNDKNGSPPVKIDLRLSFLETDLLTKQRVLQGY